MEALHLQRVLLIFVAKNSLFKLPTATPLCRFTMSPRPLLGLRSLASSSSHTATARAGWFLGLTEDKKKKMNLPETVKAGDPVLHEPAQEVVPSEIKSEKVQKIIDDMIGVMRKAPGVGLAAPQIGIPSRVSFFLPKFCVFLIPHFPILCLHPFYLTHSR